MLQRIDALYPDLCGDERLSRLLLELRGDALYPDFCGDESSERFAIGPPCTPMMRGFRLRFRTSFEFIP